MATTTATSSGLAGDAFRAAFRGDLIEPGDARYDEARAVYNGMIDRRPRLIARVADTADVIATVGLARETGLPLAIRGGGHNAGGLGGFDDAIVVDLSAKQTIASRAERPGVTSTTPAIPTASPSRAASSRPPASAASRSAAASATSPASTASRSTACSRPTSCSPMAPR